MNAVVPIGSNVLTPTSMDSAIQLAEMMARGKLVPQHLQDSPGDCLMVIEQALRWGMSPFAVAQCTSVIQKKLMFEGKLVSAALHTSGVLNGRLEYKFSGEGATRAVVASGHLKGETAPRTVEVTLASARTTNEHWNKSPDQMLTYHAARVWARRHAPEVMLGVYSPEEFDRSDTFTGPTLEATPEPPRPEPVRAAGGRSAATSATPRPAVRRAPEPPPAEVIPELEVADPATWMTNLRALLAACQTQDEVTTLGGYRTVGEAIAKAPPKIRRDITDLLAEHFGRFEPGDDGSAANEVPEVEILGAEKLGAGD